MERGKLIVRMERTRCRLASIDPAEKEKLLIWSQKMDELIVKYYQTLPVCDKERNSRG